jgi:hypothetical protein
MKVKVLAAFVVVVFGASCAGTPAPRQVAGDRLYEAISAESPTLAVIDSRSRNADRKLGLGVPSPDWRHLYSIVATSLVDTDPGTGSLRNSMQLGGSYGLPAATANGVPGGLSPNGMWLVVQAKDQHATHMLVINTQTFTVRRHIDLAGEFDFDAVNDSGDNVYLVQHLAGREYYVRLYDIASGTLTDNIVVDKSDGEQAMAGVRLSGVASLDHGWLFSVYVREHENPFVHALNLDAPFAFCLDLPGGGYAEDPAQMDWSLALSPDGKSLYAVNTATGVIAVASTGADGAPAIVRTAHLEAATGGGAVRGAISATVAGAFVVAGGPSGVTWIDATTLRIHAHTVPGWSIAGVGLSSDRQTVYAVSAEGRIAVIATPSARVVGMFDPGVGEPMALMRVEAA